jgi:hypothetical protein
MLRVCEYVLRSERCRCGRRAVCSRLAIEHTTRNVSWMNDTQCWAEARLMSACRQRKQRSAQSAVWRSQQPATRCPFACGRLRERDGDGGERAVWATRTKRHIPSTVGPMRECKSPPPTQARISSRRIERLLRRPDLCKASLSLAAGCTQSTH